MSELMTLVGFLTARLDEATRSAEASGPHPVAWLTFCDADGQLQYTAVGASADERGESGIWIVDGKEVPAPAFVHVIYDPALVLREVAAKRRIVAWASDPKMHPELIPEAERYYVLTALALPYDDHPDFQEAWRP
jgi:hypothetical protein